MGVQVKGGRDAQASTIGMRESNHVSLSSPKLSRRYHLEIVSLFAHLEAQGLSETAG